MIDLDAYLHRIGYRGPRAADLATLAAIQARHPAAVPFENLDPLLGRPVPLALDALMEKMVRRQRGGYCFEQNLLLRAALETIGFQVTGLAARVLWMLPPGAPPHPKAHMVLKIDLGGTSYLADVGFGALLLTTPLKLAAGPEQKTPWGTFRLTPDEDALILQTLAGGTWHDMYRFTQEPQFPVDYEVANWFTSTHPKSRFRNNLMLQRVTQDGRVALLNRKLTHRPMNGPPRERVIADARDLAQVLTTEFGLDSEAASDAGDLFARTPAS